LTKGGKRVMTKIFNLRSIKDRRRQLRHNMPEAEAILWSVLKNRQIKGYRFLRQYSFSFYIVDFYCPKLKIAIEIYGSSHLGIEIKSFDSLRQKEIESYGISFIRFKNEQVIKEPNTVLNTINKKIEEREKAIS
jgi:very-short-patch-repair endonuclease